MLEADQILVRLGITKAQLRNWLRNNWVFKTTGGRRLKLTDQFNNDAIKCRHPFIIAANRDEAVLASGLNSELGIDDADLQGLLATSDQRSIVKDIQLKTKMPYDMKKFEHF